MIALKILFVDDDEDVVESFSTALKMMGHEVRGYMKPSEALEYFKSHTGDFDLIISDFTMSEMQGSEFIEKMQTISSETPFVLCTGNDDHVIKNKAEQLGIHRFLYKPFDFEKLEGFMEQIKRELSH